MKLFYALRTRGSKETNTWRHSRTHELLTRSVTIFLQNHPKKNTKYSGREKNLRETHELTQTR